MVCYPVRTSREEFTPMMPMNAELEHELEQIVNNVRTQVNTILDEVS